MKGIDFVVDEKGKKKAVVIDFKEHGEIIEDIFDAMVAKSRKKESSISLATLKRRSAKMK